MPIHHAVLEYEGLVRETWRGEITIGMLRALARSPHIPRNRSR